MHAAMKYSAPKSAPQCCSESTSYADDSDYSIHTGDDEFGGSMFAHRKAGVHDDAIIAFLLLCLEIYQAEQQRKRKLH